MNKDRIKLAEWAVDQAKKAGADQAAVNISNSRDVEIEYRDSKLDKLKESTQNGLSIKIYVDEKYSTQSTNDMRKESLQGFIKEAVAMTKYLSKDEFRSLPDPKYYCKNMKSDLKLVDKDYDKVTAEKRVEIVAAIEEAAMKQSDQIISATSWYGDTLYQSVKVHSNGFVGESMETQFYAGGEATVKGKGDGRPSDYHYGVCRNFKDLPSEKEVGKIFVDRALAKVGQDKIESGQYHMIIENRSASRLLGVLFGSMSASSIQQKRSFLEGMQGKEIASPLLTVVDDPSIPGGFASRHYDGEGLAAKKRVMIEKGVLNQYYIDTYYGKKLGWEPNGGSRSNILLDYGKRGQDEIIKDVDKGIFVTGFIGGNSNSTTGDFSFGIVGQLVENGKIVKPVNEMNISGNALEFWKKLVEVGNDPYKNSSQLLPTLCFEGVHFAGL